MNDQLIIFDTTLRDGEQSPGASMTRDELRICRQLERMKVNIDQGGFAARPRMKLRGGQGGLYNYSLKTLDKKYNIGK